MKNTTIPKEKLKCFLLVDDDDTANFIHERVIRQTGLNVHVQPTESAKEGLEYLTGTGRYAGPEPSFPQPGIIFLDINMPGLSGWDFLTEYDKLPDKQKAQVVIAMLTTSMNPDDEERAKGEKDLDGFLRKPLTGDMVQKLVDQYWPGTI